MNGSEPEQMAQGIAGLIAMMFALPFLMCGFLFVSSIFWIWMIIHCARNDKLKGNDKVVWILIVIFLHLLGSLLYFFIARKPKTIIPPQISQPKKSQQPPPLSITPEPILPKEDSDKKYYDNYGKN